MRVNFRRKKKYLAVKTIFKFSFFYFAHPSVYIYRQILCKALHIFSNQSPRSLHPNQTLLQSVWASSNGFYSRSIYCLLFWLTNLYSLCILSKEKLYKFEEYEHYKKTDRSFMLNVCVLCCYQHIFFISHVARVKPLTIVLLM